MIIHVKLEFDPLLSTIALVRAFSADAKPASAEVKKTPPPQKTSFGGLKDEDRIFTNLYGR